MTEPHLHIVRTDQPVTAPLQDVDDENHPPFIGTPYFLVLEKYKAAADQDWSTVRDSKPSDLFTDIVDSLPIPDLPELVELTALIDLYRVDEDQRIVLFRGQDSGASAYGVRSNLSEIIMELSIEQIQEIFGPEVIREMVKIIDTRTIRTSVTGARPFS